jgi:hypothetical protein
LVHFFLGGLMRVLRKLIILHLPQELVLIIDALFYLLILDEARCSVHSVHGLFLLKILLFSETEMFLTSRTADRSQIVVIHALLNSIDLFHALTLDRISISKG